jgi:hypothetical protein
VSTFLDNPTRDALCLLLAREGKPTVPQVSEAVEQLYDANASGGCLHIVLDEGNVDDASVRWCIDYATRCGDSDAELLARVLLRMSKTQRRKL